MSYLTRACELLQEIEAKGLYRTLHAHQLRDVIDFSSNDYLGLSTNGQVLQAFHHATRAGSGGSRLLGGRNREHSLLEEELAQWLGRERALLFSSGYLAALGVVSVLSRCVDAIYSDALNHASLIDGMRLARIERHVYPHNALPPRAQRVPASLIVTESIFSMDGDAAPLEAVVADLGPDDVLLIDEAHALGVAGQEGAGCAHVLNDPRVVIMGTLSKAFGGEGGFIAGPAALIDLAINTARSFIFDTAPAPALALAARVALHNLRADDDGRRKLRDNVTHVRAGLTSLGLPVIGDATPIVPVPLGDEARAVRVSADLLQRKIYAPAIRPPTVPPGTSRLRLSLRADHTAEQIDLLVWSLGKCIAIS